MAENTFKWYLNSNTYPDWAYLANVFNQQECELIQKIAQKLTLEDASTIANNSTKIRKNMCGWFDSSDSDFEWIYRRLTDAIVALNKQFWNFDLDYIESLQYTVYSNPKDHYSDHVDTLQSYRNHVRKLSFSVQLSDPKSYNGCNLMMRDSDTEYSNTTREQGAFIAFPSYTVHKVSPLVSGKRISLVGWVCGLPFK